MRGRRRTGYAALAAGLVLLAGCGTATSQGSVTPSGSGHDSAIDLVGLWQLEADGEEPGTVLRIGADLSVWRPCSESWGDWAADDAGHFVATLSSYSYACAGPKPTRAPQPAIPPPLPSTWLTRAVGYRVQGADRVLLDSQGRSVAHLRPGGRPTPNPDLAPQLSTPPVLDGRLRHLIGLPTPLPSGATAPTAAGLVGTWVHAETTERPTASAGGPYATFQADGTWSASDGCNPREGRWALGPDGWFLTAESTGGGLVGCATAGQPTPERGRRLGLQGSTLISYDLDGKVTGRWIREPSHK